MHPHGGEFEHASPATEHDRWARLEAKSATVEADLLRAAEGTAPAEARSVLVAIEAAVAWLTTLVDS